MNKILLLLVCTLPGSAPFTIPSASRAVTVTVANTHYPTPTKLLVLFATESSNDNDATDGDADNDQDAVVPSVPYGTSYLKELLPTPRKRTLKLDKHGRRIHDLTDDGTAKYNKEFRGNPIPNSEEDEGGYEEEVAIKSEKELAADASSADFGQPVKASADLKALLPTQKMRFIKLDKFGRRIQRMEDDGTVNMKKEPQPQRKQQPTIPTSSDSEADDVNPAVESVDAAADAVVKTNYSPSLAEILGRGREKETQARATASFRQGGRVSVDLKELLPQQKMQFMKLDKFGRRVQRMEDDGTVNFAKEPAAAPTRKAKGVENAMVDLDRSTDKNEFAPAEGGGSIKYGSLKDLHPTTRATWTKLDFKGGSVEDERRTKQTTQPQTSSFSGSAISAGNNEGTSGNLKQLLPKREIWTKLDFHGASVRDERRTKKATTSTSGGGSGSGNGFNEGGYSSLSTLLPERTITWKKNQVLSSGSATTVSENVRGMREERQKAMRDEVIASATSDENADEDVAADVDDSLSEDNRAYTNLKDLLPERKFTWRSTSK